jgi:acetyltransferase-like isoleucine patch superfamily enzyme
MAQRNWKRMPWRLRYEVGAGWASDVRRLLIQATHMHCHVEFQGPVRLGPGFQLSIPNGGTFIVGPGVDFRRRFMCEIAGNGKVVIGPGSIFTGETMIQCTTSIEIGARCAFGQATFIADGNHKWRDPTKHLLDQGFNYRPIVIEDFVSVMTKSTILNSIGQRSVIAAHSVVTKPMPAFVLAGGAPAKVIDSFAPANGADGEFGPA